MSPEADVIEPCANVFNPAAYRPLRATVGPTHGGRAETVPPGGHGRVQEDPKPDLAHCLTPPIPAVRDLRSPGVSWPVRTTVMWMCGEYACRLAYPTGTEPADSDFSLRSGWFHSVMKRVKSKTGDRDHSRDKRMDGGNVGASDDDPWNKL